MNRIRKQLAKKGSALIVVLWTIMLLSLFIASFAFEAHLEAGITSYSRKRLKADNLARSGMVLAELVLMRTSTLDKAMDKEDLEGLDTETRRLIDTQSVTVTRKLGEGEITVNIVTEMARRNVNLLRTQEEWEGVLDVGDIPEERWPELIDSYMDWVDPDNDPREKGGETDDYYGTLEPPYKAKNGDLDTVDELLLVKGFDKTVLYGGVLTNEYGEDCTVSGIADVLTTFGSKKVNVNAALPRVLLTLPNSGNEMDLIVGAICEELTSYADENTGELEWKFFENDGDMFSRIPELNVQPLRDYVSTQSEQYYRITSVGSVGNVKKTISCTVSFGNKEMIVLRWSEEG